MKTKIRKFRRKRIKPKNAIINNERIIILTFLYLAGVLLGSFIIKNADEGLLATVKELTESYINNKSFQSVLSGFLSYFIPDAVLAVISAVFGLSLIGELVIWWVPLFRGIGLGIICSYLLSSYELGGLLYNIVIIIVPAVFSVCALLLCCKENLLTTAKIRRRLKEGKVSGEENEIKFYILRNVILMSIIILSAALGSILSYTLSGKLSPL